MNAARIRAELDAIIESATKLKVELEKDPDTVGADSPWCTPQEYADYARVNRETVRRWIMDGMPAADVKKDGGGKIKGTKRTTRIHREQADAWRAGR